MPDIRERPPESEDLPRAFRAHVLREQLFPKNGTVLVGVSGRSDSVALVRLLAGLSRDLRLRLVVGHVQREDVPETSADAMFVHHLATTLTLPFSVMSTESAPAASQSDPWSIPLTKLAEEVGATVVATAETQDDAAERFLTAVLGDHPSFEGLLASVAGMRVRPLLPFSHEACVTFLTRRGLLFRLNPNALALDTLNAKIRLLVLPIMRRHLRANAAEDLAAASEILTGDHSFLDELARAARDEVRWNTATDRISLDRARWKRLPQPLRRRLLRDAARVLNPATVVSHAALRQLDAHGRSLTNGSDFALGGLKVSCADGILTLHVSSSPSPSA